MTGWGRGAQVEGALQVWGIMTRLGDLGLVLQGLEATLEILVFKINGKQSWVLNN